MIYVAITAPGLRAALKAAQPTDFIWCGADAISIGDFRAINDPRLTRFEYGFATHPVRSTIDRAIETIQEHHPDHPIWIEAAP